MAKYLAKKTCVGKCEACNYTASKVVELDQVPQNRGEYHIDGCSYCGYDYESKVTYTPIEE